ncbi:MAG: hypothetical protein NZ874_00515, partial [Fimbriimonadales bacterium]|nr:hypothetical protein [Fimbriimonadales bacterium]
ERGYNEEEIRQILAFLERAMRLPAELEEQYEQILEEVRRQRGGDLISSIERKGLRRGLLRGYRRGMRRGMQRGMQRGLEEGRQQGLQQGLQRGLQQAIVKTLQGLYGEPSEQLIQELSQVKDTSQLLELMEVALHAGSLAKFHQHLRTVLAEQGANT